MRLERKGNHYIVFDTKKDGKEVRLGKIAAADYEVKGKLLELSEEKRRELDELIASQKRHNMAVVLRARLVLFGMTVAEVNALAEDMDSGEHPLPDMNKAGMKQIIDQMDELRGHLDSIRSRLMGDTGKGFGNE